MELTQKVITRICSFCNTSETHTLQVWMKLREWWLWDNYFNLCTCEKPECHVKFLSAIEEKRREKIEVYKKHDEITVTLDMPFEDQVSAQIAMIEKERISHENCDIYL